MNRLSVFTQNKKFDVAPNLYGIFFEDINRSGDSGLYPEMLRNRAFEDSIPPERCVLSEDGATFVTPNGWKDTFNHGEGLSRWVQDDQIPYTPIPAWYPVNAEMELDEKDRLNARRLVSLKIGFGRGGSVYNTGFAGVPMKKGDTYAFYMFAKADGKPAAVKVSLESADGRVHASQSFRINAQGYSRYDAAFTATSDDFDARLVITAEDKACLNIGFTSLMPADTFNGHGLRKDLMEKLAGLHAKFLRFPGGCIVEGFTFETAMRFSNTIGPVWERPSHQLMWHYRATNGLGYHEYLQLCEDLDLEPMYVFNCGLTCQGRAPEYFDGEGTEELLQEAVSAIEYAIAPEDSKWGKARASAGHPAPFKMGYVEIGNENHGPEYHSRYKKCYEALKARFPSIELISNTHTERDGLPTEIADEHYYNTPEFFAEKIHMYDNYDRNGPQIFVGEYAVTQGHTRNLHCALYEAMFFTGMENNQDIVTLSAYAPLLENVHYASWSPNLIAFDNHRSFGIPSYHALGMFGKNRGKEVVESSVEADIRYRPASGLFGIGSGKPGMQFKTPSLNGAPVGISHSVLGRAELKDGMYTTIDAPLPKWMSHLSEKDRLAGTALMTLGDNEANEGVFEVQIKAEAGIPVSLVAWASRQEGNLYIQDRLNASPEEVDWSIFLIRKYEWIIQDGFSSIFEGRLFRPTVMAEPKPVKLDYGSFNMFKIVTRESGFECYINDELVQSAALPPFPEVGSVVTTDDSKVIIKLVNVGSRENAVEISLDCDVAGAYEVELLAGDPMAENTLDHPDNVAAYVKKGLGASRKFVYTAPAASISILKLDRA